MELVMPRIYKYTTHRVTPAVGSVDHGPKPGLHLVHAKSIPVVDPYYQRPVTVSMGKPDAKSSRFANLSD